MDNKEMWRRIESTKKVANHFNKDSVAEAKAIKRMMKEAALDMILKRELGHREVRQIFEKNSGLILIKICDEEEKKARMKETYEETINSMKHCGDQVIMKEGQIASFPVKELVREADAE